MHDAVRDYAVRLVMTTCDPAAWGLPDLAPMISLGASPRGTLGLLAAGRALAVLRGRNFLVPRDIYRSRPRCFATGSCPSSDEALADGITVEAVLHRVLSTVPAPAAGPGRRRGLGWRGCPDDSGRLMTDRAPSVTDQLGRAEVLRRLELQILRRLDGRARAITTRRRWVRAVNGPARGSTSQVTMRAESTGT